MPQDEQKGKGSALPFRNDGSFLEQFMKMQQAQAGSAPEDIATGINHTASDLPLSVSDDKTNDAEGKDDQDTSAKTDAEGSDDDKAKSAAASEDNAEAAAAPKPGPFAKFAKKSSGAVWRTLALNFAYFHGAGNRVWDIHKVTTGRLLTELF